MHTMRMTAVGLAMMLVTSVLMADIHYVSPTGSQVAPYLTLAQATRSIQTAVNAASAGDTVLVNNGTYVLTDVIGVWGVGVTVKSINGRNVTIVDGNDTVPGFILGDANVVVEGFTIRNCRSSTAGGGVEIRAAGTLRNCYITENTAVNAGGVFVDGLGGLVDGCDIIDNTSSSDGGGVLCRHGGIINSTISNNSALDGDGGGLYLGWASFARNCILINNSAANAGGGAYLVNAKIIEDSFIQLNTALYGGGIAIEGAGTARRCRIIQNTANGYWSPTYEYGRGGGVHITAGEGSLRECLIDSNVANDRGGGVALVGNATTGGSMYNCVVNANQASYFGGGVYVQETADIIHCTIIHNEAIGNSGGGVYLNNGGNVVNSIIYYNTAPTDANWVTDGSGFGFAYVCTTPQMGIVWWNIEADPQFMDGDGPSYLLKPTSGCINWGTPVPEAGTCDIMGHARIIGPAPDLGAHEFGGVLNDYNGNGSSEMTVVSPQPTEMRWFMGNPNGTIVGYNINWGFAGCYTVPGDYDKDGKADMAVFHPPSGKWYIRRKGGLGIAMGISWGFNGCVPVAGDYDGDGKSDLAVYYPPTGRWYIRSMTGAGITSGMAWGFLGCTPVAGDYDGDGKADLALYHAATSKWYIRTLSGKILTNGKQWGFAGCTAVSGDYDSDGRSDLTVFHAASGGWYSTDMTGRALAMGVKWGFAGCTPMIADFNGGGRSEIGAYYQAAGKWYIYQPVGSRVVASAYPWGGATLPAVKP